MSESTVVGSTNTHRARVVPVIAGCLLVAALLPGCLIRSRSSQTATGTSLAAADVRSIKAGETTGGQLIESFGAPTERMDRPDGSATWKWCKTETRKSSGSVFLVLGSSSTKSTTACTVVDLKDGVVTQVRSE